MKNINSQLRSEEELKDDESCWDEQSWYDYDKSRIGIANLKIVYRNCYEDIKAGRLLNWSGLRAVFNWLSKNQTKVILGTNQNKGLHNH